MTVNVYYRKFATVKSPLRIEMDFFRKYAFLSLSSVQILYISVRLNGARRQKKPRPSVEAFRSFFILPFVEPDDHFAVRAVAAQVERDQLERDRIAIGRRLYA